MLGVNLEFSFLFIILCLILGFGCSFLLYYKENVINKKIRGFLFVVRGILISFILFLFLNPFVKSLDRIYEKPIIVVAQDASSSLARYDIKNKLDSLVEQLQEKDFDVFCFNFSDIVHKGLTDRYSGIATNYSKLLETLNNKFINKNVAGVILASDGIYNIGANPLYTKLDFPYYTLALGDTTTYKDVAIHKIVSNEFVFLGNQSQIELRIRSNKCMGEKAKIQLIHNDKILSQKEIHVTREEELHKVYFNIESFDIGIQKYTCKISPLKGENNYQNNIIDIYIQVIDQSNKILILVGNSHPDIYAYKSVVEKNIDYNVSVVSVEDFDEELDAYQLIVLSGVSDNLIIQDVLESRVPVLVFSRGDLSVYKDFFPSIKLYNQGNKTESFVVNNPLFSRFTLSQELKELLKNSPPLYASSSKLNIINSEDVILYMKRGAYVTEQPMAMLDVLVDQKNGLILAEGFWRMKFYDYRINQNNLAFDELFNKITQLLIFNQDRSKFRVSYSKQNLEYNDIYFEAEIYNEIYELVNDKEIELEITSDKKEKFSFLFLKENNKYFLNLGVFDAGDYYWEAKIRGTDLVKKGKFTVQSVHLEEMNLKADHSLLLQLSRVLDGKLFFPNQINELVRSLNSNKNTIIHFKEKTHPLINIYWILLILLFLITLEWFIRKYNGLI